MASIRRQVVLACGALAASVPGDVTAESLNPSPPPADKRAYTLFHRTPRELLRDLETDRPDLTESPITVDAGWFQVEADLFNYARTRSGGVTREDISAPLLNIKAGLLHNWDLEILLSPYNHTRIKDETTLPRRVESHSGFGDMQIRTKVNLWGNDGGTTAFGIMPFIHLPTGEDGLSSEKVEGGIILPFAAELPAGFGLGAMWEVDFIRDTVGDGYHAEFIQSLALGRDLTAKLSAYVEFFSVVSTESDSPWLGQFDFGFNYLLTKDIKLDAGVNIGVTRSAPDWNPFVGMTWRF